MRRLTRFGCGLALLLWAAGGRPATANYTFNLVNVTFNDGASLTGSFTTNDALTALVSLDITAAPDYARNFSGFHYRVPSSLAITNRLPYYVVIGAGADGGIGNQLTLDFREGLDFSLTPAGVPILFGSESEGSADGTRQILPGSVVLAPAATVPEPGSLWLSGIGAMFTWIATRSSRKA